MTVEEIEIIVTAKVEEALKQIKKIEPAIRKEMKKAQESFANMDTSSLSKGVKQATKELKNETEVVRRKVKLLKDSSKNNAIKLIVNSEEAQIKISQMKQQLDNLKTVKFNPYDTSGMKINYWNNNNSSNAANTIDVPKAENSALGNMYANWGAGKIDLAAIQKYKQEQESIKNSVSDTAQSTSMWTNITRQLNAYLDVIKKKISEIKQTSDSTAGSQSKLSNIWSILKSKISQSKVSANGLKGTLNKLPNISNKITNNIKNMGAGLKQGVKHIARYALALFSLRGIYSILSNSARSWLSSQNSGAQQLSANIEYMKYAMRKCFCSCYRICYKPCVSIDESNSECGICNDRRKYICKSNSKFNEINGK